MSMLLSRHTRRRAFIFLIGAAATAWPLAGHPQQPRNVPRIGVLLPGTPASFSLRAKALLKGLKDLGYVDGKTIAIEWRWGEDRVEQLPELAAELVGLDVDLIVTGGTPAAKALKSATRTKPIIMAIIGDPVAAGLVDSLARPGGNATGFSIIAPDLSGKRLQLLKEIVPGISSVAVMSFAANPQSQIELREMQAAARTLNLRLYSVPVADEALLDGAFKKMREQSAQALIVLTDPIFYSQRSRIAGLAAKHRLPAMHFFREFVEVGGLMSYGPSDTDLFHRAASYVDRVLKGARPGDLPVEQPTKFQLVINLKSAKALGLDLSPTLLARADEVIE
jgi:putative ABC transport system substrate-binding protein